MKAVLGRVQISLLLATLAGCTEADPIGADAAAPSDDATVADADAGAIDGASPTRDALVDAISIYHPPDSSDFVADAMGHWCDRPGSLKVVDGGVVAVPGGGGTADLSFLTLPNGFCAHMFANVGNARQIRFAPGGELFVASPTTGTTGGGPNGQAAILILPDDNKDGYADGAYSFLTSKASTQGILFAPGRFLYQDGTRIMSIPYLAGDRAPEGPASQAANITVFSESNQGHWPKTLDIADDGTIYVGNGGVQTEQCDPSRPFHGGILKLEADGGATEVARGFRNPIAVQCQKGHNRCYALELALDYSGAPGGPGREKVVPIRQGDDWGFPCCASQSLPYPMVAPIPDCTGIVPDVDSFLIGDTPFGIDFEPGLWPAPWTRSAFIALHGAFGSWTGARLVSIATDPTTGALLPATTKDGTPTGALDDFAIGWDDDTRLHGRPAALAFAPDGRLFVANDNDGTIIWIAPIDL